MNDLHSIKATARAEARARRKAAAAADAQASERAAGVFLSSVQVAAGDTVAVYLAIQSELDPAPLVQALRAKGVETCFPVVIANDTPLEFRLATEETRFVPGGFGTSVPEEAARAVTPDVIAAPLLAFDRAGYRLGYGGGFYDRTLEMLRGRGRVRAYGYAFAAQEVDAVPIEPTDQRLDGIVTEQGFIRAVAAQ